MREIEGTFKFRSKEFQYANTPCERAVEIPLARHFVAHHSAIIEVGAVTPYWWGGEEIQIETRNPSPTIKVPWRVVDPCDPYPHCERSRAIDVDYRGEFVLSISTLEHIGLNEYSGDTGNTQEAIDTLCKIVEQASEYMITWPSGYNYDLDNFAKDSGFEIYMIEQKPYLNFFELDKPDWSLIYGPQGSEIPAGRGTVIVTNAF